MQRGVISWQIQYLPQYILDDKNSTNLTDDDLVGGFDCEGNELRFNKETEGLQVVVQRYFLRTDNNKAVNESSALALACDAGHYALENPETISNYGDDGEIIMKRVDYFRVLLGVETNNTYRYMPVDSYMALPTPRPRILSVQLGALVRSTQSMGSDAVINANQTFKVLDQTVKVKASTDPKYIRQVVSQTIALRNAFGERE